MSDLPFGLDPTSSISQKKLQAFSTGRMNTTVKKTPFQIRKEQQDRKKKESEHEAAMAYAEFIDYYEDDKTKPKAFLKADTLDADRTKPAIKSEGKRKLWLPDNAKLPSQTKTYEPPKPPTAILGSKKSAKPPKKMSNMELFKERIKQEQQEREARHAMKKAGTGARGDNISLITSVPLILPPPPSMFLANPPQQSKGSQDNGDPTTTNLYVGNLSPQMNEAELCRIFGRFGPLASVKIMWPRTAEEHSRGRMCGFVAFMSRKDGDQCLTAVNGMEIMGHDIKLGWGKAVPLPPRPFYVHAATKEGRKIKTGLPFNAQPKPISAFGQAAAMSVMLSNDVGSATIVVVIPGDKRIRQLIHRTIEFVVREGPEFEALLIKRTAGDTKFQFLVNNTTHEHIYYRWKLFSVLQGDKVDRWSKEHFCMFEGGSTWEPPAQDQLIMTEEVEKGHLSTSDRDTLEEMLRSISPERQEIARAMVFCLNHASAAQEVVDCIAESLSILETPAMTKVARLFLVSDILHNCSAHVRNASYYRNGFEGKLPQIFLALHQTYRSFSGRLRAEQFRQHVTNCLEVWKDWNVFTPMFFKELECMFRTGSKEEPPKIILPVAKKPEPVAQAVSNEPKPLFPDDDDDDDDVDGEPMEDDDDDDVDGVPLAGPLPTQTPTFTPVVPTSAKRPVSLSKWEQDDDDDDDVLTKRFKR
eukprot:m.152898 g.152898  ORF g.152898 m.152898 type:complete len:697 (-) comp30817_c2_seq7:42-2132(-)